MPPANWGCTTRMSTAVHKNPTPKGDVAEASTPFDPPQHAHPGDSEPEVGTSEQHQTDEERVADPSLAVDGVDRGDERGDRDDLEVETPARFSACSEL